MTSEIKLPEVPERQIKIELFLPESMNDRTTEALEKLGYAQFDLNRFMHRGDK